MSTKDEIINQLKSKINNRYESLYTHMKQPENNFLKFTMENTINWLYVDTANNLINEMITPLQFKKVMKHLKLTHFQYIEIISKEEK